MNMAIQSPTFSFSGTDKSIALISSNLTVESPEMRSFWYSLQELEGIVPIATVVLSTLTITITFKDARSFAVTLVPGTPPKFSVSSSGDFALIHSLGSAISALMLANGLSAMEVTYA